MPFLNSKRKESTNEITLNFDVSKQRQQITWATTLVFVTLADSIGDTNGIHDNSFATHDGVMSIRHNCTGQDNFQFHNLTKSEVPATLSCLD